MKFTQEVNIFASGLTENRFSANETALAITNGNINLMITESELAELRNGKITMYSKMMSMDVSVSALQLQFSDLTTKYDTVSGQYTMLDSRLAEYKVSLDGLSVNISQVAQNLENNYSTTTAMNTAISASVGEVSVRVSSLETWKNEASLKITDSAIVATVTSSSAWDQKASVGSLSSLISMESGSINIISNRIRIQSDNLTIDYDGTITAKKGVFSGSLSSATGTFSGSITNDSGAFWVSISTGIMRGGVTGSSYSAYASFNALHSNTGVYGMRLAGRGIITLLSPYIAVGAYVSYSSDSTATVGVTTNMTYVKDITINSSGQITSYTTTTVRFIKGLMVTATS